MYYSCYTDHLSIIHANVCAQIPWKRTCPGFDPVTPLPFDINFSARAPFSFNFILFQKRAGIVTEVTSRFSKNGFLTVQEDEQT